MTQKTKLERYEVEWCSKMPVTEFGDADPDRATYKMEHFQTAEAAEAFARSLFTGFNGKIYPKLACGCAMVHHQRGSPNRDGGINWADQQSCEFTSPNDRLDWEQV